MKLADLAKMVMKEDTWGNNPAAAAPMSPGKTPNAVSPAPQPVGGTNDYDVGKDFQNFETTVEKEEEAASKNLENTVKQKLGNKKVTARASKGSVGQTEQDYEIDVASVTVTYMGDKHYVVLKGSDDKEYYLNPTFKVRIVGAAEKKKPQTPTTQPPMAPAVGKKPVGSVVYPQNMGLMGKNK